MVKYPRRVFDLGIPSVSKELEYNATKFEFSGEADFIKKFFDNCSPEQISEINSVVEKFKQNDTKPVLLSFCEKHTPDQVAIPVKMAEAFDFSRKFEITTPLPSCDLYNEWNNVSIVFS